jgi:hypothetical protein
MIRQSLCAVSADNCFYVGLGDQFDDDRRLVREATSGFGLAMRPTWAGASVQSYAVEALQTLRQRLSI